MRTRLARSVVLALVLSIGVAGCAGHKAPILVGNAAVAVADSIAQLSNAGKQLEQAAVMPTAVALGFQSALLEANTRLKPLPDILRTIDRLQQADQSTTGDTARAIALLTVVGQDVSVVVAGVPVSAATAALINLIRAAQQTIQTVLIEVAKIKGRE